MKRIDFAIAGQTGLLCNRFGEDAQGKATRGVHTREEQMTPGEDAQARLYVGPDGVPYFPAENLRQSLIIAASRHKIGRRSAANDAAAALFITPDALALVGEWEVDARPVVIPATKGRILRYRPLFRAWRIAGTLMYDERLIDARLVRAIMDDAGNYVGIGDFRPAKKGPYGRFSVTHWDV